MFVGKSKSTHIIKGYDNLTFRKDVISENIGCQDDRSVQTVDGNIVWLGQDAVYAWSGAGRPEAISRDIDPIIKSLRQGDSFAANWILNTQGDFEAGNLLASGAGAPISATISAGSLVASTFSAVDTSSSDFMNGTLVNLSTQINGALFITQPDSATFINASIEANGTTNWISTNTSRASTCSGLYGSWGWRVSSNKVCTLANLYVYVKDTSSATVYTYRTLVLNDQAGTEYSFNISTISSSMVFLKFGWNEENGADASTVETARFVRPSTITFRVQDPSATGCGACFDLFEPSSFITSATFTSQIFDTSFATPTWGPFSATVSSNTDSGLTFQTQVASSASSGFDSAVTATLGNKITSAQKRVTRYVGNFTLNSATSTPAQLFDASLSAATTGYYISPIKFVGTAISTYGALDMLESIPSGSSITYDVRAGTYSFPPATTSIAWTAIANHATVPIAVSTPTYFQYRALLLPVSGDHLVALQRSQLSWTEGTVSPPVSSGWKDGRYFLCATISTSTIYPDTCLVYQRNKKWTTFTGFSAASMTPFNRDLIVGSGGTDSYVWKILQDDVYNDDGSAIAATWISKDFMFAPNGRDWAVGPKAINEVWLDAEVSSSTYLSVGYALDKASSYTSSTLDLGAWGDTVNKLMPFTTTNYGKYVRVKLYNADLDKSIKVNGYSIYGEPNGKTQD